MNVGPPIWHALWPSQLRHRLVLVVSLVLLLAIGLLGGYTAAEQTAIAQQALRSQAQSLARHMAVASASPIVSSSLDELEAQALRLADFPEVQELHVLDTQGYTLAHVVKDAGGHSQRVFDAPSRRQTLPTSPSPQVLDSDVAGILRIQAWHPVTTGSVVGWVRVDYDASAMEALQRRIWHNTGFMAALAVALCWGLIVLFLRRPMRALARAAAFAKGLAANDGRLLPVERAPQEIEALTLALNDASTRLHQQMLAIDRGMQQLRLHEAQLSNQNEQLDALFALSPDGLATFNREGRVQFANQAFLNLTGLRSEIVIGASLSQLDACLRALSGAQGTWAGLDACFAADAGEAAPGPQVLQLSRPEGPRVLHLVGVRGATSAVSRVLYVVDVTHQHQLDQMKSEFLSMAAHELRTPMASIYGFTELMLKREMSPEKRQDLLSRIYRQSQGMITILNELLDLARIEARRGQDFVFETVDLRADLQALLADYTAPEGRELPLLLLTDDPLPARVDRTKFRQALTNVLSNAYKYSPQGRGVTLRLCARKADDANAAAVGVEVIDEGIGMAPAEQARLGERFFRADKSGNIPGTGLGLSIVKELLGLMGGQFDVVSQPGQGTRVTLWVPAATADNPATPAAVVADASAVAV